MKKFYTSLMVLATVAVAFSSCSKEVDVQEEVQVSGKMKTITVRTDIETRTTLDADHANLVWSSGDQISIFNDTDNTNSALTYAAGGDLTVQVPDETEEIYAHYPYYKDNKEGPTKVSVYISNKQTQKNPGELDGYYFPMVAKGTVSADNKAIISLAPVASALALNLYHTGLSGEETVQSVTVTPSSANTGFIGRQYTDLTADNVIYSNAEASSAIKVTLTNPLSLGSTKPADKQKFAGQIYVCLAKQSYANVKFEIETNKGTYTITSSDTPFDCVNNDFVPVNINLAKASFEAPYSPENYTWSLVTDAISIGDKVVIAASSSAKALSTNQQSNNRKATNISKNGTNLIATSDVQAFEVVAGTTDGSFAFKAINGNTSGQYIYAASSGSNYLRSEKELDAEGSWAVSITSAGIASLTAQGENSRNVLQYNSGNDIFACYGSASQAAVAIYKQGSAANPDAKVIISNGTIEVSATGNAADYEGAYTLKNIDEATETINLTASENIIDPLALDGDVTFSMAPNYTSSRVTGNITLTLASDESVTATIPVEQKSSSLKVSETEVTIPTDATSVTFTVTSPEFGWSITSNNTNVVFTESGTASESAVTVTVSSEVAATNESQTLATLTISRIENDPQAKTVVVKKAEIVTSTASYVKALSISEGNYLMVYNGRAASSTGKALGTTAVTIVNDEIASTSTIDQYAIEIASLGNNQYSLKLGDLYIGYKSGTDLQTNAAVASDNYKWTISIGEDGTAYIVNVATNTRYIGGNASGDSFTQFKAYSTSNVSSGQYPKPTLYKYTGE